MENIEQSKLVEREIEVDCWTCYQFSVPNNICIHGCHKGDHDCDYTPINEKWYKVLMDQKTSPDVLQKKGLGLWRWKRLSEIKNYSWC